ncbi:MAG: hypothetical protein P8H62_00345 [Henriciella sp.]|nr:hypothetical protein [Henriciella sp.]
MWKQTVPSKQEVDAFSASLSNFPNCIASGMPFSGEPFMMDSSLWARIEINQTDAKKLWQAAEFENDISEVYDIDSNNDQLSIFVRIYKFTKLFNKIWAGVLILVVAGQQSVIGFFKLSALSELPRTLHYALSGQTGWAPNMQSLIGNFTNVR